MQKDDYEVRLVKILDARHVEDTGTNDEPTYNQHVQLLLQDVETGGTFVAPLSQQDLQDLSGLNFELHSKELIEIAEWLRDFEGDVRLMVPKKGNTIDKDLLLNTPAALQSEQPSFRSAAIKRFKFDKEKLKKAN